MTRLRNISLLVFLFTILLRGPIWADSCGGYWGGGFCDCGPCGQGCLDIYCDYSPHACAEAYPGFCAELSSLCYGQCGPENYQIYCDTSGWGCYGFCQCG